MNNIFFRSPTDMEPLMPKHGEAELIELSCEIFRLSGRLSGILHPITRRSIAELVRAMNSYYSNLIEGHRTNPYDIEKALNQDYSKNPEQKKLQEESIAHINVQKSLEEYLRSDNEINIFSSEWICRLHEEFYRNLPESYRLMTDNKGNSYEVIPGEFRETEVTVGRHIPPHHDALPAFLERFSQYYSEEVQGAPYQLLAIAASHHRLAWIHPFMDGNGRVVRLFSHGLFIQTETDAGGLWAISRGLARVGSQYTTLLANADRLRKNDYDGRGRMSDEGLYEFCKFFLQVAIDQISFMSSLLELDAIEKRIERYLQFSSAFGKHGESANYLLREALRRGEFSRGEAGRITNRRERTARDILKSLTDARLLVSDTEKGPVRLGFPVNVLEYYFPLLYSEADLTK